MTTATQGPVARPALFASAVAQGRSRRARVAIACVLGLAAVLGTAGFATATVLMMDMPRTLMSRADFEEARRALEGETRLALGRCREQQDAARELCRAQARAAERVQKAHLMARYHGTIAAHDEVRIAQVRAAFDVAKARCTELPRDGRRQCVEDARAEMGRAIEQAKLAAT